MADAIRRADWSRGALGPIEDWDAGLTGALETILEARFPMFIAWGDELTFFFNDAYEPVLQGKPASLGEPLRTIFPEAWSRVGPLIAQAVEGQASYFEDFEVPLVRNALLSSTWWSFSYSPLRAEDGSIGGVLGVVYETTRRLLADEALRSSEAALRTVTDMTPGMLWRCDPDGRLTWINQRLGAYFGLEQPGAAHWDDFVWPEDITTARKAIEECISARRPFEHQQRLRGADGRYRWFMVRCQQVLDGRGEVTGWCGSAIDIDEWRMAAAALSDGAGALHDFYGAGATLLWVADVETRWVTPVNTQSGPSWALSPDGEPRRWEQWAETVHGDDRAQFMAVFDRVTSGKTGQSKFRLVTGTGPARRFQLTAFPIGDGTGAVRRIGGLVVEIGRDLEPRAYLVDPDPVRADALSQAFARRGFRVRTFSSPADLDAVSDDLLAGVVIMGVDHDMDAVTKAAARLQQASHLSWIAVGDFETRLEDVVRLMKLGASDVLSRPAPDAVADAGQAALALARPEPAKAAAPETARQKIERLSRRER